MLCIATCSAVIIAYEAGDSISHDCLVMRVQGEASMLVLCIGHSQYSTAVQSQVFVTNMLLYSFASSIAASNE